MSISNIVMLIMQITDNLYQFEAISIPADNPEIITTYNIFGLLISLITLLLFLSFVFIKVQSNKIRHKN